MNKQALKLKKKRKAIREKIKQEKFNKIIDDFVKSTNYDIKKDNKELMHKVYRTIKKVDNEVLIKCGVISLIISLLTLKDVYSFNKDELIEYSFKLQSFINRFTSNNKSILDFVFELENDLNIPIFSQFEDCLVLTKENVKNMPLDEVIIKSTSDNMPYFLTICVYTFINYLSYSKKIKWDSEYINKFISNFMYLYKQLLRDVSSLSSYHNLLVDFGIYINLENGNLKEIS